MTNGQRNPDIDRLFLQAVKAYMDATKEMGHGNLRPLFYSTRPISPGEIRAAARKLNHIRGALGAAAAKLREVEQLLDDSAVEMLEDLGVDPTTWPEFK